MWTLGLTVTRFGQNLIGQCFSRIEFVQNAIWSAGVVLTEKDITRFMEFESLVHEQVTGRAMENYFAGWSRQLLPIHNLSQALTERDGRIAHLNQVVAERDRQIASSALFRVEVLNSISWRITRPLRVLSAI
jgi:hypothetical protein